MKNYKRYIPLALSITGGVGVVATAIFSSKATLKAHDILQKEPEVKTTKDKVKKTWKCYILPVSLGIGTVACIAGSNFISDKHYKALASAYILADQTHKLYQQKNIEINGMDAHQEVIKAVNIEQAIDANILVDTFCSLTSNGFEDEPTEEEYRVFYEPISKRYFRSTKERVILAEYHLNRNLLLRGFVSLNEFFGLLGIDEIPIGDELGWNCFNELYWIDFNHGDLVTDDGIKAKVIDPVFSSEPNFDEDA